MTRIKRPKKPLNNAHVPTEDGRKQVELMAAVGITREQIASFFNIHIDTLASHYEQELAQGALKANVKVAHSLYQLAISGNVSAQIFWCKTRLGWRDVSSSTVELTKPTGEPLLNITFKQ